MDLLKLGLRNINRNKRRTIINTFTIAAAVIAIILFDVVIEGQWDDVTENYVKMGVGHVKIHNKGYDKEVGRLPLNLLIDNPTSIIREVSSISEIKDIYTRIKAGGLISHRGKQAPVIINGIDFKDESNLGIFSDRNINGRIPTSSEYGILIGQELASLLKVNTGEIIFLYSRTKYETHNVIDLEITGIYNLGFSAYEMLNLFIPLKVTSEFLGTKGASELILMLSNSQLTDNITDSLKNRLSGFNVEVFPYYHYMPEVQNISAMQESFVVYIRIILMILALFGILNMMMISAWERKKEIGMMRAIGYNKMQITGIFLYEGLWTGILGSLLGIIIAFAVSLILVNVGIPLPKEALSGINIPMSTHMYGKMLPEFFYRAFFLGIIVTIIASIPSSLRASFLPIVKSLQEF